MRISDWSSDVCSSDLLRAMLAGAFEPVLDEPLPAGLAALAKSPGQADIVDFAAAKERRSARRAPFVQRWGSIAATLAVGIVAGHLIDFDRGQIGRASCRERVCQYV